MSRKIDLARKWLAARKEYESAKKTERLASENVSAINIKMESLKQELRGELGILPPKDNCEDHAILLDGVVIVAMRSSLFYIPVTKE